MKNRTSLSYTNVLKKAILTNVSMNWQNVQLMGKRERKSFIKDVIGLSKGTSSFVLYTAKFHLAYIIHVSECYYNNKGFSTPVKEFLKLGWYSEIDKNIDGEPIYSLDFNKVMQS